LPKTPESAILLSKINRNWGDPSEGGSSMRIEQSQCQFLTRLLSACASLSSTVGLVHDTRAAAAEGPSSRRNPQSRERRQIRTRLALAAMLLLFAVASPLAHEAGGDGRLPVIGPAPPFTLTSQDGKEVALADLRGKVVAVTFIYTGCPDVCPLLTDKMARVQDELGAVFGAKVAFISITLDPENDTPAVLRDYARRLFQT
jgi:hypothetical protein